MASKIEILKKRLQENEEIIVTDFYNLVYYANIRIYTGERLLALIVGKETKPVLLVNELFNAPESDEYDVVYYNDSADSIAVLASYLHKKNILVDDNWTSGFLIRLMNTYPADYENASRIIVAMRQLKDEEEKAYMIQASRDNDYVMEQIKPYIKLGVSEKYLHDVLMKLFEERTHEKVSFEPIVAFGANAADPHHMGDDTILKEGDVCLIDMGSHYHGYCSDMTRTFLQKNEKMEEIYEIVKNANIEAEKAIRPGMKYCEIDQVARDYISSFGYGEYFTHRLGHGIGLQEHEGYDVSISDERIVEPGACFSIEPGIYLPGIGGVRIEDLVIVTEDGCLVLNSYSKEKQFI